MNRGINLSAALKNASENVFGVEAEVDIGTQGHIGANTCVCLLYTSDAASAKTYDVLFCSAEASVKVLPARRPIRPMMLLVSAI